MKKLISIIIALTLALNITACNNSQKKDSDSTSDKIEKTIKVYYFHYSHRCRTCVAVEQETKKALGELYPEKIKTGKISFQSIDMDEPEGEKLAEKMKISGQTLIFVQNDKTKNLTNDGFMYAVTNPEKLKTKIKQAIENF